MSEIKINQRNTNERGAWATLRYDANGGQYYEGVYYVEEWAPDFPDSKPLISAQSRDRKRSEKAIRQWLAGR